MKEIKTERLNLRLLTEADYEAIFQVHSIPEVDRYNTLGIPENIDVTIKVMKPLIEGNKKGEVYVYGVRQNKDDRFIGVFGIRPSRPKYNSAEVWYKYIPEVWGQGIATEVMNSVLDFCFNTLKLHRVEAGCAVENRGSIRVMEKVGMLREGRRRATLPLVDGWSDNYEYAILDSDYEK